MAQTYLKYSLWQAISHIQVIKNFLSIKMKNNKIKLSLYLFFVRCQLIIPAKLNHISTDDMEGGRCHYLVLVLVLVVDERGSFSAIDAHIFPCLIQTVLEDVD